MSEINPVAISEQFDTYKDVKDDPYGAWAAIQALAAALSSAAVAEREPVATVAEVFVDGKRLYNITYPADALDKLPKGAALYLDPPPTSELEAENARLKEERDHWKAEYLNASADAAKFANDLVKAETRVAVLEKVVDEVGAAPSPIQQLGAAISRRDWHEVETSHAVIRDAVGAARRVREGGKVDG